MSYFPPYIHSKNKIINELDIDKLFELDTDKLKPVLTDLDKLSDVVKIDVVKKKCYNAKIQKNEDKMSSFINAATYPALDAKINKVKGEIPSIAN